MLPPCQDGGLWVRNREQHVWPCDGYRQAFGACVTPLHAACTVKTARPDARPSWSAIGGTSASWIHLFSNVAEGNHTAAPALYCPGLEFRPSTWEMMPETALQAVLRRVSEKNRQGSSAVKAQKEHPLNFFFWNPKQLKSGARTNE